MFWVWVTTKQTKETKRGKKKVEESLTLSPAPQNWTWLQYSSRRTSLHFTDEYLIFFIRMSTKAGSNRAVQFCLIMFSDLSTAVTRVLRHVKPQHSERCDSAVTLPLLGTSRLYKRGRTELRGHSRAFTQPRWRPPEDPSAQRLQFITGMLCIYISHTLLFILNMFD